jgi:hypothetical protein
VDKQMNRKQFLQSLFVVGIGALAAGTRGTEAQEAGKPGAAAKDPCSDTSGLTEAELKMRNDTLKYTTKSPDPKKECDNCKFWQPPTCGTCQLVKGPIAPKGYCISWFTAGK